MRTGLGVLHLSHGPPYPPEIPRSGIPINQSVEILRGSEWIDLPFDTEINVSARNLLLTQCFSTGPVPFPLAALLWVGKASLLFVFLEMARSLSVWPPDLWLLPEQTEATLGTAIQQPHIPHTTGQQPLGTVSILYTLFRGYFKLSEVIMYIFSCTHFVKI